MSSQKTLKAAVVHTQTTSQQFRAVHTSSQSAHTTNSQGLFVTDKNFKLILLK